MDTRLVVAILIVVGLPALLIGYILLIEAVLRLLPGRWQNRIRPWLWITPALSFLGFFLVYPTINTVLLSLQDKFSKAFVGLANYQYFFSNPDTLVSLRNNVIWIVLLTALAVGLGLIIAVLVDRVRYEPAAKSVIFLPLAISFVGAGIIWRFVYDYAPAGEPQTGLLNAAVTATGLPPQTWLQDAPTNTIALIIVAVWIWTGFCMVILSAALKSISPELMEAARVDGANELQVFRRITFPLLLPAVAVVATTMVITALKAFDIVYVMTSGNFDTNVVANQMYKELFTNGQPGRASAIAVVLLVLIVPVMFINIRRFREQEAIR